MRERASRRTATMLVAVLFATGLIPLLTTPSTSADPTITDNWDGTSTVTWNFSNPGDYITSNVTIAFNSAELSSSSNWWNTTTQADWTAGAIMTNIDATSSPGDIKMASSGPSYANVTLQPDGLQGDDTYVDAGSKTTNYGNSSDLIINRRNNLWERILVQFNISALPPGAIVRDAQLQLYMYASNGGNFNAEARALIAPWDEGTATWNDRQVGTPWISPGGDYSGYVEDSVVLDNVAGWKTWNVKRLVDSWVRGSQPNYGLIIMPSNNGASDRTFYSSDYPTDPTLRPKLFISYQTDGETAEYVSAVGGSGSDVAWKTILWQEDVVSKYDDEFSGSSLDPKWSWRNPPLSYDVGITTLGSLRVNATPNSEFSGLTANGNLLYQEIYGDFQLTAKLSCDPQLVAERKCGIMAMIGSRDWYNVYKTYNGATYVFVSRANMAGVTSQLASVAAGNPEPFYLMISRTGNTFRSYYSSDGVGWTELATAIYTPTPEYPLVLEVGFFIATGIANPGFAADVDWLHLAVPPDASTQIYTRSGNTTVPDASWSGWIGPYADPSGTSLASESKYIQFRILMQVFSPHSTPLFSAVNISYGTYDTNGWLETMDFSPSSLEMWSTFSHNESLNGGTIGFLYSTDSGGSWTPVPVGGDMSSVGTLSGKIRFRAEFSTPSPLRTPILREMSLIYVHSLDHIFVDAPTSVQAGTPFTVTVYAKDAGNNTIKDWTGSASLEAVQPDGATPANASLWITSANITSQGWTAVANESYSIAETIRIRVSASGSWGLSWNITVTPGALDRISVLPQSANLTLGGSENFSAYGFDQFDNPITTLNFTWSLNNSLGTLNTTVGRKVQFTANLSAGTVQLTATSGNASGSAQISILAGPPPVVTILVPLPGEHISALYNIVFTASNDSVRVDFEYDQGTGWVSIGTTTATSGIVTWDTSGIADAVVQLRAVATNSLNVKGYYTVASIEVDNNPPGAVVTDVVDLSKTSNTMYIEYSTAPDAVNVTFFFFNGSWYLMGTDATIDGNFTWYSSGVDVVGLTIRMKAIDEVGLSSETLVFDVGTSSSDPNAPRFSSIPDFIVRYEAEYDFDLSAYVDDPDTTTAALAFWTSDSNVSVVNSVIRANFSADLNGQTIDVTLWVSDGVHVAYTKLRFFVSDDYPPAIIALLPDVTFNEDETKLDGFGGPLNSFFDDPDGEPLTFLITLNNVTAMLKPDNTVDFAAPENWYGSSVVFARATDPRNGFQEMRALVTVLPVNDPPVMSPIPEITVEYGRVSSFNLSGYIYDVDDPLTSLLITADSPMVEVSDFFLLLNFTVPEDRVTFTLTVSDGKAFSSVPVTVRVVQPATPPFEIPSYYFAAFGAVLAVGAIMAPRLRWKLVKGFLVDDSGTLIREYKFSDGRDVTYEQVQKAWTAAGTDVSRFTVSGMDAAVARGDGLSLVLVAKGPIAQQEIGYAQMLLSGVEDKVAASIGDRWEQVSILERQLDATREELDLERENLEKEQLEVNQRLREVESRAASLEEERGKVQSLELSAQSLKEETDHQRLELEETRKSLAFTESDLQGRTRVLEERDKDLAVREEALKRKALENDQMFQSLISKEERLNALGSDLSSRESALASKERELTSREQEISRQSQENAALSQNLEQQRLELERKRSKMEESVKALLDQQSRLREDVANLNTQVESKREEIARAQEHFESYRVEKEAWISSRLKEIEDRERMISETEKSLQLREERVKSMESEQISLQERLSQESQEIEAQRKQLEETRFGLDEREKELKAWAQRIREEHDSILADLQNRERNLEAKTAEAKSVEESFERYHTEKSKWIDSRTSELEAREKAIESATHEITVRESTLAEREKEISNKEKAMEESARALQSQSEDLKRASAELEAAKADLEQRLRIFSESEERSKTELEKLRLELESRSKDLQAREENLEGRRQEVESWVQRKTSEVEERESRVSKAESQLKAQEEMIRRSMQDLTTLEKQVNDRLEAARNQRQDLERLKQVLETRSGELWEREAAVKREEAEKREQFKKWQETMTSQQGRLEAEKEAWQKETSERERLLDGRDDELKKLADRLKEREEDIERRVRDIAESEARLNLREAQVLEMEKRVKTESENATATKAEADAKLAEFEERSKAFELEASSRRAEVETKYRELQDMQRALEARTVTLNEEFDRRRAELDDKERKADEAAQKSQDLLSMATEKQRRLENLQSELSSKEERLRASQHELDERSKSLTLESSRLESLSRNLAEMESALKARERELQEGVDRWQSETAARNADINRQRMELERRQAEVESQITTRLQQADERERVLEDREVALRAEEDRLKALSVEVDAEYSTVEDEIKNLNRRLQEIKQEERMLSAKRHQFEEYESKRSVELARKEKELEDTRNSLETQRSQLTSEVQITQAELEAKKSDLEALSVQLENRKEDVQAMENKIAAQLKDLEKVREYIEAREKSLQEIQIQLDEQIRRTRDEAEAEKRSLIEEREQFEQKKAEIMRDLSRQMVDLEENRARLEAREKELGDRETSLGQRERAIEQRLAGVEHREKELSQESSKLEGLRKDLERQARERDEAMELLRQRDREFTEKETALRQQAELLEEQRKNVIDQRQKLRETEDALKKRSDELSKTQAQLDLKLREVSERDETLDVREGEIRQRERDFSEQRKSFDASMAEMQARDASLIRLKSSLEKQASDLSRREEDIKSIEKRLAEEGIRLQQQSQDVEKERKELRAELQKVESLKEESEALKSRAKKEIAVAERMRSELDENTKFLQKRALELLDKEEKLRNKEEELASRDEYLEEMLKVTETKDTYIEELRQELERQQAELAEERAKLETLRQELQAKGRGVGVSPTATETTTEEMRRDWDHRLKILQQKALDLLDREEKLREKEAELRSLEERLKIQKIA